MGQRFRVFSGPLLNKEDAEWRRSDDVAAVICPVPASTRSAYGPLLSERSLLEVTLAVLVEDAGARPFASRQNPRVGRSLKVRRPRGVI